MKEQIKTPEKELSNEETDNLFNAEFKTLVITMLTELIELGRKMKEEMKATQSEIKQNIQGTNSEGKETGTQINDLEQKEEINIHLEQNEETRIQKNEERIRNLWDNFKAPTSESQGARRRKGRPKTEKLFEKLMKENFPNLAKEIDFQEV